MLPNMQSNVVTPMTRTQLKALKTEQDIKMKNDLVKRIVNEITNMCQSFAKQGKTVYSAPLIVTPTAPVSLIKDDVLAGLKVNFPDSVITFDAVKNTVNVDWT